MAHMNQEIKARLTPAIKAVFKKYGLSGSISVKHHSSLQVLISKGPIDFISNYNDCLEHKSCIERDYMQVNQYWIDSSYTDKALDCLQELNTAVNAENYDNSDIMSDYVDVGYWTNIYIGDYNKPYRCTAKEYA